MTKPEITNSVTFVSFVNLILVIIALALSTNVYCKLLVLVRGANALDFLFSTTPQPQSNNTNLTPYYLLILLIVACFIVFCLIFVYIKMRTTSMLDKRVPHTKISMAFFEANDFIAIDFSHTGQMAKDLRIETHAANVPKAYMSMLTLNIKWNGLTFESIDGLCLKTTL